MDFMKMSHSGLLLLHNSVHHAFAVDEAARKEGRSIEYGVREHSDWKIWSDKIEEALQVKGIDYTPVNW